MNADRPLVMLCDVDIDDGDATRIHTLEVARLLAEAGFAVELVARGADPQCPGVRYVEAGRGGAHAVARIARFNARAITRLVANRRGPRLLYVRYDAGVLPSILLGRMLRFKVIGQYDDITYGPALTAPPSGLRGRIRDRVSVLASRTAGRGMTGAVAVSAPIRDLLVRDFRHDPARVLAIPNGVDTDLFTPRTQAECIARSGLDPTRRYVVFCGQFAPWSSFDLLVPAFAHATRGRPDIDLLMVGDGAERPHVEELIQREQLAGRVILTGRVSDRSRVAALIGAGSVCILGTDSAFGSPVKLGEYLAAGRPVVALDRPAITAMIRETGGGISVPYEPEAFGAAIGRLLDDPAQARQMGEAGRAAVVAGYSWRSVVERTLPLFELAPP
jgi:glycosyltransferase involved in cell wall biosynthesis